MLRSKRYQQPQVGPSRLSPYWVSKGLVWAFNAATHNLAQVNNPGVVETPSGLMCETNGTSNYLWAPFSLPIDLNRMSLMVLTRTSSTSQADRRIFSFGSSVSSTPLLSIETSATPNFLRFQIVSSTSQVTNLNDENVVTRPWVVQAPSGVVCIARRSSARNEARVSGGGIGEGVTTAPTYAATTYNRVSIGTLLRSSAAAFYAGETGVAALFSEYLSDEDCASLYANPWQIFEPSQRILAAASSGGTSSVFNDSAASYLVRASAFVDSTAAYSLRGVVAASAASDYSIRTAALADSLSAYNVRSLAQSDDVESYLILGSVNASDTESYLIRGNVSADSSSAYDIMSSAAVSAVNTSSYAVRGNVASDSAPGYVIRGSVLADCSAGYSIRSSAYRDLASNYVIDAAIASVFADLTTGYSVYGVIAPCPSASDIATAVLNALKADTIPVNVTQVNDMTIYGTGLPPTITGGVVTAPGDVFRTTP